jgi:hypothetical protein
MNSRKEEYKQKQEEAKETCKTMIKILTKKEHIIFTSRCNEAIRISLQIAKEEGGENGLYQEEGGWLTYKKYIEQAHLTPITLTTNDGIIFEKELQLFNQEGVLIINSLAGYVKHHDMNAIETECLLHDIFLINDVSGSIGSNQAKQGDIIVGSFGKAKPVPLGEGGFFATNNKELYELFFKLAEEDFKEEQLDFIRLKKLLEDLPKRLTFLKNTCEDIKQDLKDLAIVHPEGEGCNVIIRYENEEEKKKIINYCEEKNLEYTSCPREIRILDEAISIEVKRLNQEEKK